MVGLLGGFMMALVAWVFGFVTDEEVAAQSTSKSRSAEVSSSYGQTREDAGRSLAGRPTTCFKRDAHEALDLQENPASGVELNSPRPHRQVLRRTACERAFIIRACLLRTCARSTCNAGGKDAHQQNAT